MSYLYDSWLFPPFSSFLPLPKPGIHSFKSVGTPLQNKRDHAPPDLDKLSFSPILPFSFLLPPFPFFYHLSTFFLLFLSPFLSEPTPFFTPSVLGTPPLSLELPQLHKHSSIPKVHSWPHLLLFLTTKYPSGPKVGFKQPITWSKTGSKPCLGLIWGLWARSI